MKTFLLAVLCVLSTTFLFGQKVDIDNHKFYINYIIFPKYYTPTEERTYSFEVLDDSGYNIDANDIFVNGWVYSEDNPTLKIELKLNPLFEGDAKLDKRTEVKKDDDGKVISSTTYYSYVNTNYGNGVLNLFGPVDRPYQSLRSIEKAEEKARKKKAKAAKKKAKEKKEVKENPFLKNVDIKEEVVTSDNSGKRIRRISLDIEKQYVNSGSESTSIKKAKENYYSNSENYYRSNRDKIQDEIASFVNNPTNRRFGYIPTRDYVKFKKLDSKKHPEYEMYRNATEALKKIFSNHKPGVPKDKIKESILPIIDYFRDVANRYSEDSKHPRRLKAASLYNIAQTYYWLDMPEKTIEVGQEMIGWKPTAKAGKKFIKKGSELKYKLDFYQISGRHLPELPK